MSHLLTGLALTLMFAQPAAEKPEEASTQKPLRVLLLSDAGTREFQYVLRFTTREEYKKRFEVHPVMQSLDDGKSKTVDLGPVTVFTKFVNKLEDDKTPKLSLNYYDLVVAFDPNWEVLSSKQRANIVTYVREHGGSLIVLAGPSHTYKLVQPKLQKAMKPIRELLPVELEDYRLKVIELKTDKPHRLNFTKHIGDYAKLDEKSESPLGGWDEFFGEDAKTKQPKRGFFSYYPAKKVKKGAKVLATYGSSKANLDGGKGDEQPYLVEWKAGKGMVLYMSGSEFWRLRQWKSDYHHRWWLGVLTSFGRTHEK